MAKFKVFKTAEEPEQVTRFALKEDSFGGVRLIAVDAQELFANNILEINSRGEIALYSSVNETLGLSLESRGFVKVVKNG
jgi:hypothetical protein